MQKLTLSFTVCLLSLSGFFFSSNAFSAELPVKNSTAKTPSIVESVTKHEIPHFLGGIILVVDMDQDQVVNKDTVLKGADLVLVKVDSVSEKAHPEHKNLVIGVVHPEDLAQMNVAHNGTIEAKDFGATNLALLRLDTDATITLAPLATSHIKQINFPTNSSKKPVDDKISDIELVSDKGQKFEAYYLDLSK